VEISYEELLRDTTGTLRRVLAHHVPGPVDDQRLAEAVDRNSFERRSGRRRGQVDSNSFMRKGIAGDWLNYTSREAGEEFEKHFGGVLGLLGYETRRDWWRDLDSESRHSRARP